MIKSPVPHRNDFKLLSLWNFKILKGTVSVISSEPPSFEGYHCKSDIAIFASSFTLNYTDTYSPFNNKPLEADKRKFQFDP